MSAVLPAILFVFAVAVIVKDESNNRLSAPLVRDAGEKVRPREEGKQ